MRDLFLSLLFFILPLLTFAQVGPMGIGNADGSPTSAGPQPRLLLWLDGSSAEPYTDGANLDVWIDKSGNGHNFTPAAGNRPDLALTGPQSGPNATPALRFFSSPVGRRLECPDFELTENGYSIYFVVRTSDDIYNLFSYSTPSSEREMVIYNDNGIRQQMADSLDRSSAIGDLSDDQWNYGGITWSSVNGDNWEYKDSAAFEGGFNIFDDISLSSTGTAIIGDVEDLGGGFATEPRPNSFSGIIAEIFIYEGRLSRPATRLLTTYLWVKYGIEGASPASDWEKFNGDYGALGGDYYNPIGIGNDDLAPNGGSINEARSKGLVLRVNNGEWTQGTSYLCAAPVGSSPTGVSDNSPTPLDLVGTTPSVTERWSRVWEIAGNSEGNSQEYQIGFDFGDGIDGGETPSNPENFVLLYRDNPTSGNFSVLPVPNSNKFISDDELIFRVPKSDLITPGRYYTIGTVDVSASPLTGVEKRTWYAYQTGDWSDPLTWTLDGSASPIYVNPGGITPAIFDDVYIGAGRSVTLDEGTLANGDLKVFGTLDCASAPQPSFDNISGSGLIRCSAGNFPLGNSSAFADPDFGGTLEFYGSGGFTQTTDLVVNKLKINLNNTSATMTLAADLTTNGLFEINNGSFVVNNTANTPRTLTSNAQVLVEGSGKLLVSNASGLTRHKWFFYSDLINNGGEVKFTNRSTPGFTAYSNNEDQDIIVAYFSSGSINQELRANGPSYFSRIVIDKGVDMTYILSISSNNSNYFKLLGPCNTPMEPANYTSESINTNSFALINGTAEIRENIFIPLQTNSVGNSKYNINYTAQLWVNGGEVTKGRLGGGGNTSAIVPYGNIKVTDGVLNALCTNGIALRENAIIQIDGGVVNTNSIRTSFLGSDQVGGIIINGGVVNVDGNMQGGTSDSYYTFSLSYPGNLFSMTGGVLNVTGPSELGLIFINSDPQNTSVSGGTVNLDISDDTDIHKISSRAAFWNLNLSRSTSSNSNGFRVLGGTVGDNAAEATMDDGDLIVRNNLIIEGPNNPSLNMEGEPVADLYIYGDLEMGSGCEYNHNNNTTYFIGSSNSSLSLEGSSTFPFFNVEVNKDFESRFVNIQETGPTTSMDILGSLNLEKGFFINNDRDIEVKGNVTNRTRCGNATSTGDIIMNGTSGQQRIISQSGIFHGLLIDNPDGVRLENDGISIRRRLRMDEGHFLIGDNKLRMETTIAPFSGVGPSNFIICSGNASAGGVEVLFHSGSQNTTFPIGVSSGEIPKYTPAVTVLNGAFIDSGYVRIAPVDTILPTSNINGEEPYLKYYWRVRHSEFNDLPLVSHRFEFDYTDTVGTASEMVSGRVLATLPFERQVDELSAPAENHVNTSSRYIYYNGSDASASSSGDGTPLVDADYSAGSADRFPTGSSPDVFFSRSAIIGAEWENITHWNKLSDCGGCEDAYEYHSLSVSPSSEYPQSGDIAVIGFDVNGSGKPHVYKAPPGGIEAAQIVFTPLQDTEGNRQPRFNGSSVADLGILRPTLEISNTSDIIKVGQITGEGALMLKGNIDLGVTDIGGFLAEDSSLIVVKNGVFSSLTLNFLPPVVPNLFLAETESTITSDLRIRGNLEVAGQSKLYLNEGQTGNLEIDGDLILDQYQLTNDISPEVRFNKRGILKTISVHGDVKLLGTVAYIGINEFSAPPGTLEPWTPDELSPLIWLDAQDATTVNPGTLGANATSWQSKGSGSYIADQTNTANQPVYQAGGLNGFPTLRFDGSDFLSILHDPELNINANQDFEIFSVAKQGPPGQRRAIYAKGQTNGDDFLLYQDLNRYRLYLDGGQMSLRGPNNLGTNPNMGWGRRQGNSAFMYNTVGGNQTDNNVSQASTFSNTHNVTIGAAEDGTTRFLDGDIAEIILIKRALTTEEREQMEGYLAHKWGLQGDLPAGHPYRIDVPYLGVTGNLPAQLIVDGNIIQDLSNSTSVNNGLELFETGSDAGVVNLVVTNSGTNQFDNQNGPTPRLWKIFVDKGINTTSSFTFNSDVNIDGPADEPEKPVNIENGLLKFNHPNIDITLSSGGGNFVIPGSGGLELDDGDLHITGNETGLILAGSLNITGGSMNIGDTEGQNNYIEYGGGSSPKINISNGLLVVGSQIRRNLSSTGGALDYRQSGGDVIIGRYSAPESNRGMLEVTNAGSRFDHTGGTLTFVRGVNLSSTPSLLLNPSNSNVNGASEIIIGNSDSPSGAAIQNFGIQSIPPLNSLTINSTNSPVVNLITNSLELNGDLTIQSGATLNCGERNLTLNGDVSNDGNLNSTTGTVSLVHPTSGTVAGDGNFNLYDFQRSGSSGQTLVQTDLLVKNNFTNDEGELDFEGNTLTVEGNVTTDGILSFNAGSNGLIFGGTEPQILTRTSSGYSEIDILTINNNLGVTVPAGSFEFIINKNLRLEKGVFSLTGNLLEMAVGSVFTPVNPFSESNMIVTGGAFSNFGLLMNVPANSTDDIFVPLGIDRYMPVNLDFTGGSSGSTASKYLLRLNIPNVGVILADSVPVDIIDDASNVLDMYFSVDGTDVGNSLDVDLKFRYNQQYVQVTSPYTEADYIAARVLPDENTISKFGVAAVNEVNDILTYNIQGDFAGDPSAVDGDYFAGVDDAIPNTIPVYRTALPFVQVENGTTGYNDALGVSTTVPGGGAPTGAVVIVESGDVLNLGINGVNFYRTEIQAGAAVLIPGTSLHRLGKVTGSGTLQVGGSGNLPAGDYTNFFGCPGGRLNFQSSAGQSFEVLSNMPSIYEVRLIGPGEMVIANSDVNICNKLTLTNHAQVKAANSSILNLDGNLEVEDQGTLDFRQGTTQIAGNLLISGSTANGGQITSGNNGSLTVQGDLIIGGKGMGLGTVFRETHVEGNIEKTSNPTGGSIQEGTGGAKLVFDGIFPQTITGDFIGDSKIPFIELNNGTGLTLNGNLDISDTLKLTAGNIFTDTDNMLKLTDDDTDVDPVGGSPTSFVDGPMQWFLANTIASKKFPIGKNDRFRPLAISNRSAETTWEVEYSDTVASIVNVIESMAPDPFNNPAIETVSIQEFWRVKSDASAAAANIGLSYGDNSGVSTSPSDQDNLLVLAYNDDTNVWESYGGQDFNYDTPTNRGSLNSIAPVSFSEKYLTLGSSDELNPLPVTWLYFEGENNGKDNLLSWATSAEINNDYFKLERSLDAHNWTSIAEIEGAGMSNSMLSYTYTDQNAPFGRVYYRLRQVDFDGQMEFAPNLVSLERSFAEKSKQFDFLLFPNPTQLGTVRFRMSNTYDVRANVSIFDLSGKQLSQSYVQIDGQGTSAPVECNYEPGIYLVRVIVNDKMRSKPLVITR